MSKDRIILKSSYIATAQVNIILPKGKTQDDIKDVFRKWDTITIEFNDGTHITFEVSDTSGNLTESIDFKRPDITHEECWDENMLNPENDEDFGFIKL